MTFDEMVPSNFYQFEDFAEAVFDSVTEDEETNRHLQYGFEDYCDGLIERGDSMVYLNDDSILDAYLDELEYGDGDMPADFFIMLTLVAEALHEHFEGDINLMWGIT